MYSQNNEEQIIINELSKPGEGTLVGGRFLDIGAWDGKGFSNTYRLAELGWSGVCVEPSPSVFPKLIENHKNNDKIVLVNAAVSPALPAVVAWYDSGGDAISTTVPAHAEKWATGWKSTFTKFFIYTLPIPVLFQEFGTGFQFINIDVESANRELFQAMPWFALTETRVICVEHDGFHSEMSQMVAQFGFYPIHLNGENLILARHQ